MNALKGLIYYDPASLCRLKELWLTERLQLKLSTRPLWLDATMDETGQLLVELWAAAIKHPRMENENT